MIKLMNYVVEANIGLLIFYIIYVVMLSKETNFTFRRLFLLGGLMASLVFPLFSISFSSLIPIQQGAPTFMLPAFTFGDQNATSSSDTMVVEWTAVMVIGYGVICFIQFCRFAFQLQAVANVIRYQPYYVFKNRFRVIETESLPTFSFFRYIVVGNQTTLNDDEKAIMIEHECVHAQKLHSIDLLVIELLRVVFWFNPIVHYYKKTLLTVHEFQADACAVEGHGVNQYCNLLARVALMSADFKLANHFNNSLTLKRITMIKTMKRRMMPWKIMASLATVGGFFLLAACQDQISTATDIARSSTVALDLPAEVRETYEATLRANPDKKYTIIEATTPEGKEKIEKIKQEDIASLNVITPTARNGEQPRTFMIVEFNKQVSQLAELSKNNNDVYTIVESSAVPVGGMEQFYQYLAQNLRYPEDAKSKNIGGMVFVQFEVGMDGQTSNFKILKAVHPSLDKEAIHIIKDGPKWTPATQNGKTVVQQLTLPIQFGQITANSSQLSTTNERMNITMHTNKVDGGLVISGSVQSESGKALGGANIVIQGTTQGTAVNDDGTFNLKTKLNEGNIVVSYIGYETASLHFN